MDNLNNLNIISSDHFFRRLYVKIQKHIDKFYNHQLLKEIYFKKIGLNVRTLLMGLDSFIVSLAKLKKIKNKKII